MYVRPQGPLGAPSFARSSNPKKNPDQLHIFIYKSYIIIYRSSHDKCQTMEPSHFFKLIPLLSKDHSSNNPPDPPDRMMVGVVGLEGVVDVLGMAVVMEVMGLVAVVAVEGVFYFPLDMI